MTPWIPDPSNRLEASSRSKNELAQLNALVDECAEIVEDVLKTSFDVYSRMYKVSDPNPKVESFLKRISLAVLFVSYYPENVLDKTLRLNLHLPTLPSDGLDEIMETVSNVRDFYLYVDDPASITATVEVFEGELPPTQRRSAIT